MRPEKRRQSWPLQQSSVGVMIGTVTLSQIVHLTLRCTLDPDANFDKQRRPIACAPILQPACVAHDDRHEARCTTERNETMRDKARISECEYQGLLESVLKSTFNTELRPLRSLETATKKRRAQKKKTANNSGFTKSTRKTSG